MRPAAATGILLSCAAALGIAAGCASSGSELPTAQPPTDAGPPASLTAELPAPSSLKLPQDVVSDVFHLGADYDSSMPRSRVRVNDEGIAEYRPLEAQDPFLMVMVYSPAFAIYRFDTTGFLHGSTIWVDWLSKGTNGDAWVGMADFAANTWHWYHPDPDGLAHFDAGACLDEGIGYAMVIVNGTSRWQLESIRLGFDLPPLITSVSPLSGEQGEEVVIEPLLNIPFAEVTSWDWDFGGAGSIGTSTEPTPTLVLGSPGVYECSVQAANAWGETDYPFFLTVDAAGAAWRHAAVGNASGMASSTSLALGLGRVSVPHIAYLDSASPSGGDLKHAYFDAGFWLTETVAVRAGTITNSSLAFDPAWILHLAYTIEETPAWDDHRNVMLARAPDGVWEHTLMGQFVRPYDLFISDRELVYPSLAVADGGLAGVWWEERQYEQIVDDLELVAESLRYKGDGATVTLVSTDPYKLRGHAGDMNAAGNPCIAYVLDDGGYGLHYAGSTGGDTWTHEVVAPSQCTGHLAFEISRSDDQPRICYVCNVGPGNWIIRYARFDGTNWQIEAVGSTGDVGRYISLALDIDGYPHICYREQTEQELRYATSDGMSWDVVTVDDDGDVGWYCDIAVDGHGIVHFSYYDYTHGCVKYAWQPAG